MAEKKTGWSLYKVIRIAILLALIAVIVLALKKPDSPAAPMTASMVKENAQAFEAKLQTMQTAQQSASAEPWQPTTFSSNEVNAFIQDASERAREEAGKQPDLADAQAQIKKTEIAFAGDEVTAQALTERYGQDVVITVRGRLGADNGYLRFMPTAFKIGELSVPVSLVNPTLQKKLTEPETREKLRLPDFISDLRIQGGQLVIVPK